MNFHSKIRALASCLVAWGIPAGTMAQEAVTADDPDQVVYMHRPVEWPDADAMLEEVRAALPRVPLRLQAELRSKSRRGQVEEELQAEMRLHWRGDAADAVYVLRDAFGEDLERLEVHHAVDAPSTYAYFSGPEQAEGQPPPLHQAVRGTDLSWFDLSLAYLWWTGGETVGMEKVKGRHCFIIDMPVPGDLEGVSGVRLWVDPEVHVLLQAATFDGGGEELRRLQVKSLRKINEIWMVKDIEVRNMVDRSRTLLEVKDVQTEPGGGA